MKTILIRHGEYFDQKHGGKLTAKGRDHVNTTGSLLVREFGNNPGLRIKFMCSPSFRAVQSMDLIKKFFGALKQDIETIPQLHVSGNNNLAWFKEYLLAMHNDYDVCIVVSHYDFIDDFSNKHLTHYDRQGKLDCGGTCTIFSIPTDLKNV